MSVRDKYLAACERAERAKQRTKDAIAQGPPGIVGELAGWEKGEVYLIGAANTWRATPGTLTFNAVGSPAREAIGKAISAWYFAMFDVERKWGAVCLAEGKGVFDLPNPDSLTV